MLFIVFVTLISTDNNNGNNNNNNSHIIIIMEIILVSVTRSKYMSEMVQNWSLLFSKV